MAARSIFRSLGWSALESVIGIGMSFLTVLVIARFIGPAEFGLFSFALFTVQILTTVVTQLFNEAIVQREEIGPEHLSTAFWTSLVLSLLLAAACAGLGHVLAVARDEPRFAAIFAALGLTIVLEGMAASLVAQMRRDMEFRWIALRTAVGRFIGSAIGLGMAVAGWGVWALVAQILVGNVVALACVWIASTDRPRIFWSADRLRELLRVAIPSLGASMLWIVSSRLFALAIGAFLGRTALGHYSMAFRLVDVLQTLSLGVVRQVALPVLSRRQADPVALRSAFTAATARTAVVTVPLFAGLAVVAPVLVPLLLGEAWRPTIGLLQVLSLSIIFVGITQFQATVFTAIGRAHLNLLAPLATLVVTLPLVPLLAPYGVETVAGSWLLRHGVTIPLLLVLMRRAVGMGAVTQLRGTAAPLAAGVVMAACVLAADALVLETWPVWTRLGAMIGVGALTYSAALVAFAPKTPLAIWRGATARGGLRAS